MANSATSGTSGVERNGGADASPKEKELQKGVDKYPTM